MLKYPEVPSFRLQRYLPWFSSTAAASGLLFFAALTSNAALSGVGVGAGFSPFLLLFSAPMDCLWVQVGRRWRYQTAELGHCWGVFFCIDGFGSVQMVGNEDFTSLWLQCSHGYATTFLLLALVKH